MGGGKQGREDLGGCVAVLRGRLYEGEVMVEGSKTCQRGWGAMEMEMRSPRVMGEERWGPSK